jgi:hypothetical protein
MNLYLIDDIDIIAAETEESAKEFYKKYNENIEDIKHFAQLISETCTIKQLTEDQLNNWVFYYFPGTEEEGATTSFKNRLQELIDNKETFPLFFASTEY